LSYFCQLTQSISSAENQPAVVHEWSGLTQLVVLMGLKVPSKQPKSLKIWVVVYRKG
jgi:hypothetical protein